MFAAGVGSVMIAHLYIPAIDTTANTATSLSKKNVTGLLRGKLNFQGLTFTDALEMKGVAKFFPGGEIAAQSLLREMIYFVFRQMFPHLLTRLRRQLQIKN